MSKNEKSFKTLLKQMDKLQEYQLGRLKGGITVISPLNSINHYSNDSYNCINNGDCSPEENTTLCQNSNK